MGECCPLAASRPEEAATSRSDRGSPTRAAEPELTPKADAPEEDTAAAESPNGELELTAPDDGGGNRTGAARPLQTGVRAVLARLPGLDLGVTVPERLQPLVATLKSDSPRVDIKTVVRAYEVADAAHQGQLRKSGEPYIIHPIGVADLLAQLGMDTATIVAALLHDTVEDTEMAVEDVEGEFGEEAAALVDGVTKLDRIQVSSKEEQQAESLRKMLIAMASDARVLLIKLADRLHNMMTIHHLPREKQKRIAEETLTIYAPLAHRLGMQNFKWQLEDLSFQTLHPKRYDEIKSMVLERQPERDRYLERVVTEVEEQLRSAKIRVEITGRPKHYYSIYDKMVVRGREFTEIYDLVGLRVIVDSVKDCYAALGTLHAMWRPIPGRFKDYIAMPKFNLYQSLHTSVVGPEGKPIEVQIRTRAMHRTAEYGIAAHWKYKAMRSGTAKPPPKEDTAETQWLSQMLDMQSATTDSGEFLRNMRLDLYADEVFVFTPKGDVVALPRGSTPVDFAYAVHTEVGHRTIGARVNERLVALEHELRNGDKVEILTTKATDYGPSRDWLEFVGSSRSRSKIKAWFTRERREDAIEKGREDLQRTLAKQGAGWKKLMAAPELKGVAEQLNYKDLDALYRAIGEHHLSAHTVAQQLTAKLADEVEELEIIPPSTNQTEAAPRESDAVVVEGTSDVWVTLARCCTPVPGDEILGFVTRGRGVSVHRTDCPNAADLKRDPERLIEVRWDASTPSTFRVTVQVEALDRKHLLRDITTVLGDMALNILSAQVTTQRDRIAYLRFTFELADIGHLDQVIAQVRRVEAVFDAYRVVPRPAKQGAAKE